MSITLDLQGKVALITGGSRGVGAACVRLFRQAGANVVFSYQRSRALAEELVRECGGEGCVAFQADLDAGAQSEARLVRSTVERFGRLDVLVVNQQFEKGIHTEGFQAGLNDLLRRHPRVVALVDCRHLAHAYPTGMHKLNALEATRLCGIAHTPQDAIPRKEAGESAVRLFARWKRPVFVTRGRNGCLVIDELGTHEVPGLHIIRKTDTVGAGDSMVAGIAASLAVEASPERPVLVDRFLEDATETSYLVGTCYAPEFEGGLRHDDPRLGIAWPLPVCELSEKDRKWELLADVEADLRRRMTA